MKRTIRTTKILIASASILLLSSAVYTVLLPEYFASKYITNVHRFAHKLEDGYTRLEESSNHDLLNDPAMRIDTITQEVEVMRNLLRENRIDLINFSSQIDDFEPLPYTGFTQQAKTASTLQERTVTFVEQSEDALNRYDELIAFMKSYHSTAANIEKHTSEFNNTADLNVYAGQSARMRDVAAQIRSEVNAFEKTTTPSEAQEFKKASIQTFTQLADGFDMFANGLSIPADAVIYEAAAKIEQADRQLYDQNQVIYSDEVLSSRTVTTIQELREKLALISA